MDDTNAIVKRGEIGVAFGDALTASEKVQMVREYVEQSIEPYRKNVLDLIEQAKLFNISNDDDRKIAATIYLEIKQEEDAAQELRKKLLAKAKKEIRSIEIPFSELEKLQEQVEDEFGGKLKRDWLDFEDARKTVQEIHNVRADKERSESGEFVPDIILAETERRINTDLGYTTIRKDTNVTVPDLMALVKEVADGYLPLTFLEPNLGLIKKWCIDGGVKQAPGLYIKDDAIIVAKKS